MRMSHARPGLTGVCHQGVVRPEKRVGAMCAPVELFFVHMIPEFLPLVVQVLVHVQQYTL